jgi:intracellular sulfur oxidation DsrE/DsrF family protein
MKIFKTLIIGLLLNVGMIYADEAKVVYDLTSGDSTKIEKHLIKSINALSKYYKNEKKELKIIVVISGKAYKYFVSDLKNSPYALDKDALVMQEKFKQSLTSLNDNDAVTFNMCSTGMKARKIDKKTLYNFVHADVMKSVYLIEAQNDGYAYMPIH